LAVPHGPPWNRRPLQHQRSRVIGHREASRQSEVEHLHLPLAADDDVAGLDVAVDDPRRVRGLEGVGDLQRDPDDFRRGQLVPRHVHLEVGPVAPLHDDEGRAFVLVDFVDRADVRVVERGDGLRFARQPPGGLGVTGQLLGQEFERHLSPQPHVLGLVDDAHSPDAQLAGHTVVGDRLSDHGRLRISQHRGCSEPRPRALLPV
jgi:hypothetical protein